MKGLLAATAALLVLSGCGSVARVTPGGPSPSQVPAGDQVTDGDANKVLRYHVGDTFEVVLHQQTGWTAWQNLQTSDRSVLLPQVDTKAAAARGVTLAKFRANAPGTAEVTASAGAECSPGTACPAIARLWKVTVQVT